MEHLIEDVNPAWEVRLRRATESYIAKRIAEGASSADIQRELTAMSNVCTLKVYGATHGKA